MQSFDINLLAGGLAPHPPATSDGRGDVDDYFAETLDRELARIDAENAARNTARQDDDSRRNQDFNDSATYDARDHEDQSLDSFNHTPPANSDAPAEDTFEQQVVVLPDTTDTNDADKKDKRPPSESGGANSYKDTTNQNSVTGGSDGKETKTVNFTDQALTEPGIVAQLTHDGDTPIVSMGADNAANGQDVLQLTPDAEAPTTPKATDNAASEQFVLTPTAPTLPAAPNAPANPVATTSPTPRGVAPQVIPASVQSMAPIVPLVAPIEVLSAPNSGPNADSGPSLAYLSPSTLANTNAPSALAAKPGQTIAQSLASATAPATVSNTNTGRSVAGTPQSPTQNVAATNDTMAQIALSNPQSAPEPASMAQTVLAAQLARSSGEAMAVSSNATSADSLPPVTGVTTVSQPGSAAAVTQPAALHRPSSQPPPADQVAVQIQRAIANGEMHINVRLHPAELGRVDVDLDIGKDGRVLAVVTAEKSETLEMLQRDTRVLERALQDAGLDADHDSLSFNLFGERGADEMAKEENGTHRGEGDEENEVSGKPENVEMRVVSDRALDIRV